MCLSLCNVNLFSLGHTTRSGLEPITPSAEKAVGSGGQEFQARSIISKTVTRELDLKSP